MKKILSFVILSLFVATLGLGFANTVEAKSYTSYKPYKAPTYRNYKSGGSLKYQKGYYKPSSGKWINGHFKTGPDNYKWNNRKSLYGW